MTESFDGIIQSMFAGMSPEEHRELLGVIGGIGSSRVDDLLDEMFRAKEPQIGPVPEITRGFRVRLDLLGTKPPVWRRLDLPGDLTLDRLHRVIQTAMGWTDSHLHQFATGSDPRAPRFLTRYDIEQEGEEGIDEATVRLDQVVAVKGDGLWYEYDFGDGWRHKLAVESVLDTPPEEPVLVTGKRACPPEDCGGVWGYAELAAWGRSGYDESVLPDHFDSVEHARDWLPIDWDPDRFDVDETREIMEWALAPEIALPEELQLTKLGLDMYGHTLLDDLVRRAAAFDRDDRTAATSAPEPTEAQAAAALAPLITLLDVIAGGVRLTAAGFLPPAIVTELATRTGVADWWIGKANREDLTYPVHQLRAAARAAGLMSVRKGVLAPTAAAKRTVGDPVAMWRHLTGRLPVGRTRFDRQAAWVSLAVAASGGDPETWRDAVRQILQQIGWRSSYDGRPALLDIRHPTLDILETLSGQITGRHADPRAQRATELAARTAIFRQMLDE